MKPTQKSILPEKELLLVLTLAASKIRVLQASVARPVTRAPAMDAAMQGVANSMKQLDEVAQGTRIQNIGADQAAARRNMDDRQQKSLSRLVTSRLRWLEDIIIKAAGTGPASEAARMRLKELDTAKFAQVLQRQAQSVGLATEMNTTLVRVYEAIDQAYPRQREQEEIEEERAFEDQGVAYEANTRSSRMIALD